MKGSEKSRRSLLDKENESGIGKFISSCRKDKGLTQMQLAEKLNISNRAVSKWETGVSQT